MDKPPPETLIRALEQLYALGALNDRGELTKLGRRMAEFPLDPMMSKVLIASERYGCSMEILTIVSMMSVGTSIFYRPKDRAVHADNAKLNFARGGGGDHLTLMRCYNEWENSGFSTQWCYENYLQVRNLNKARDVREQLEGLCERVEVEKLSNPHDCDAICKAIASGYFYNVAKLAQNGEYRTIKSAHTVYVHPSSVLSKDADPPKWLVYHELAFTTKEYMRTVAPIKAEWLLDIAPHYYKGSDIEEIAPKKMPKTMGKASEQNS
jgi:pre-mRNA-splicing factor ATP-dependent RNA helicase DHX16